MKHLLITGIPGVGKTTLINKVCKYFEQHGISYRGFCTQEIRQDGVRIGFEVVDLLSNERSVLAAIQNPSFSNQPKVGKYSVNVSEFESIALPLLKEPSKTGFLIIDEIGKMEMFSKPFVHSCKMRFEDSNVIATVPLQSSNNYISSLKSRDDATSVVVTHSNRNHIFDQLKNNFF